MPIRLTRTVKILLGVCFAAFLIQRTGDQFFGTHLLSWFGLNLDQFLYHFHFWQILTYSFFHGDVLHLFFNLMMLAFVGGELEASWGTPRFLRYYFLCATSAAVVFLLLQLGFRQAVGPYTLFYGSSAAVYGLLAAYGLIFGERVLLFMMLFPMKAKHFIWILALLELMTTLYSPGAGFSGVIHLSGMAAGFCYLWFRARFLLMKNRKNGGKGLSKAAQRRRKQKHLKLIIDNQYEVEKPNDREDNPKTWH